MLDGLLVGWNPHAAAPGERELDAFFLPLIANAARMTTVYLLADSSDAQLRMFRRLRRYSADRNLGSEWFLDPQRVAILPIARESMWVRDFGPITLRHRATTQLAFADHLFDAERPNDDNFPTALAKYWGADVVRIDLHLAGGNFQSNGDGDCFTAEAPMSTGTSGLPFHDDQFSETLGCKRVHRLRPLLHEGTGHVDMFAMLVGPRDIIIGQYDSGLDEENRTILDHNAAQLENARDALGRPRFRVHRVPMPAMKNDPIVRTFTNFQVLRSKFDNSRGAVIVPGYAGFEAEEVEFRRGLRYALGMAAPGVTWEIITINADWIILSGGAVHCVTSPIPRGKLYYRQTTHSPRLPQGPIVPQDSMRAISPRSHFFGG